MQFQLESRQACIFVSINCINHKFMETKCPKIANSSFKKRIGGTYFVRCQKKTTIKLLELDRYGLVYGVVDKPRSASSESRSKFQ